MGLALISEPAEQAAAEIAEALTLTAARSTAHGSVARDERPDQAVDSRRRPSRVLQRPARGLDSLGSAAQIYQQMRAIAARGLESVADRSVESRARLQEFHDVMAFVEREVPRVIAQYLSERSEGHR